jgi:hypothetical protein
VNFAKYLFNSVGFLTRRKILHGADGFSFPPEEVGDRNPSSLAGFKPSKLGCSGEHDNE